MHGETRRPSRRAAAVLAAALGLAVAPARAETITLRWRYPAPERAAGFRLHTGPAPGVYTQTVDLGPRAPDADGVFRARVEVPDGATTHLAISAYDAAGRESAPSNEWSHTPRPALGTPGRPQVVEP